ncbi:hypothetical protein ACLB1R_01680 [Escherichia coli]
MNIGAPDGDFDCDIDIANLRENSTKPSIKNVTCYGLKGMNWRIICKLSLNFVLLSGTDDGSNETERNAVNI